MAKANPHPRDKSLKVQQHHAADNSPSAIMAKHLRGPNRLLPTPPASPSAYRQPEFRHMPSESYHEMLNRVSTIKTQFAGLPARLRTRFQNDPYQMLRFLDDPNNRSEALKLGLVTPTDEEWVQLQKGNEAARAEAFRKAVEAAGQQSLVPKEDEESQPYARRTTPQKGGEGGG